MVMSMIRICNILLFVLILMFMFKLVVIESTASKKLQIGIKKRPEDCSIKSRKGDLLHMHYTVIIMFSILKPCNIRHVC